MDELIIALGPAFSAGFAIQRLMEILDPIVEKVKIFKNHKKIFLGVGSLILGLVLAFGIGLRVLEPLGIPNEAFWDGIVTALIISAGTEGFNSILKLLGYKKEEKDAEAKIMKLKAQAEELTFKKLTNTN